MLSVWEIRHGSVMALREILTHQGARAGVFMPNLHCDGGLFSEPKDKCIKNIMKREREIDLNIQVPAEESELILKRPKLEDLSVPLLDTTISARGDGNFKSSTELEDSRWNLSTGKVNGKHYDSAVRLKFLSNLGIVLFCCNEAVDTAEAESYCEDKISMGKMDLLKNLPENCELMNFVKLARHSWLKNSEFLQDCATRFLCVLSLDRYVSVCLS